MSFLPPAAVLAILALLPTSAPASQDGGAPPPTRPDQARPRPQAAPGPSGNESFESVRDRIRSFKDESAEVRLPWIRELARFDDRGAGDLLLELLASEKVPAVKTEIVRLLGGHGGARVLAALLKELDAARDPGHLEAAATSAARAGEGGAEAVLSRWEAAKDARSREALLRALGRSGAPAALPVLLRVFDEGTPVDQLRVLESLRGQPASPEITKRRRAALADKFGALRAEALLQLGADGDPAAKAAARAAAKSTDTRLRSAAAAALAAGLTVADLPAWLEAAALPAGDLLPGIEETFARIRADPAMLAWILRAGITSNNPSIQALSLRILEPVPGGEATGAIVFAAGKPDPVVAETALRALVARKDPAALGPLRKLFAEPKSPERRASILEAVHALSRDDEAWRRELIEIVANGLPALRCTALDALADLGEGEALREEAVAAAAACLAHDSWQVRSAALGFLSRVRSLTAMDALVARAGREEGRLERELMQVFDAYTGLAFTEGARWREWWKEARGTFKLRPAEDLAASKRPSAGATVAYYDIPFTSRRAVFCLDVSASMRNPIGTGGVTRLAEAQRELSQALERADPEVWFNLVFFDEDARLFEPRLVKASRDVKQKAQAFVSKTDAMGGTNLLAALEKAFEDPKVDTIYLLSDGQPSAGKVRSPEVIEQEVARWNRSRRVMIHCISVGVESPFLRRLAESSGGQHVVRL